MGMDKTTFVVVLPEEHRSMEHSDVKCFHCTHVFDHTNLKGEKRRNVGKLNNELNIVNQLVDLHFSLETDALLLYRLYWSLVPPENELSNVKQGKS
jgi:hypothetical protein